MSLQHSHEFRFEDNDFQRIRKLIREHAGISLSESKQELVYSRLAPLVRKSGVKTFAEYLDRLQRSDATAWTDFTNALTTNLTSFFREEHHFPLLAEHLRKIGKARPIVLWCSACSTGEEAYSMAITAAEAFGGFDNPVSIVASDLDTKVLETARAGRYALDAVSKLPPQQIDKYFIRGKGVDADFVTARHELKKMITFRQVNLLDPSWPLRAPLDVIFCRNVMIYFEKDTQLAILKRFAPLLAEDGLLFAGHSESFYHANAIFRLRGHTVYELAGKQRTVAAMPSIGATGKKEVAAPAIIPKEKNSVSAATRNVAASVQPKQKTAETSPSRRVIVVGSSTGGTDALRVFLRDMPEQTPAILVAQHMPELFTKSFAARLDGLCRMRIKEGEHQEVIRDGTVYLAPGHSHMALERADGAFRIVLSQTPPVNRHRPSVEVLFDAAARVLGSNAVGVMLTGMGRDGAEAMLRMHKAGAYNLAQDEASCVVFGMPREAIALGAVDEVVPLTKMAERVLARLATGK